MSDITRDIVYKDIDECVSNPCQNEATCNDLINEYTFPCVAGYESTNYEKVDCHPRPSQCPCYKEFRRRPSCYSNSILQSAIFVAKNMRALMNQPKADLNAVALVILTLF